MRVGEARDIPLCILQRDADALDLGEPCLIEMVELRLLGEQLLVPLVEIGRHGLRPPEFTGSSARRSPQGSGGAVEFIESKD